MNTQVEFFSRGDELPTASDSLWLIVDGAVKSYTVNREGKIIILGFWGKQEVVGNSLSNVTPYFLQCMNDVQASAISSNEQDAILFGLLDRIKQIQEISYIVRNFKEDRVWLFLKLLAKKFGDDTSTGTVINFKLTQQELADALGMKRIQVSAVLNKLERENLILQLENQYILLRK